MNKKFETSADELHDLDSIIDRSPVVCLIWCLDKKCSVEYVSGNISQWGYTPEDFISSRISWKMVVYPEDFKRLEAETISYAKRKILHYTQNFRIIDKTGGIRWMESQNVFIHSRLGKISHVQSAILDVTDRGKAPEALWKSESIYRDIFNNTEIAMGIADQDRNIILGNKKMEELTGFKKEELTGEKKRWDYFIVSSDIELLKRNLQKRLADPSTAPKHYECSIVTKSGDVKNIYLTATMIPGTQISLVSMTDITDRKKAEEALRKSEEKYREIFENAIEGIYQTTPEGQCLRVNPALARILGYESPTELMDDISDIGNQLYADPSCRQEFKRLLSEYGIVRTFETQLIRKDKNTVWAEINATAIRNEEGNILSYQGTVMDITDKKRLEIQLQQAQKMKAIGTLAGGIAHDFNNLLMGIQGYVSLMLLDIDSSHPHYERLKAIQEQVVSGADLTRQLLGFARGGRYVVKPANMNDILQQTSSLFWRTKKEISVYHKYEKNLWTVEVDRGQMDQLFMNLYMNAWQAMPGGGEINIMTENVLGDKKHPLHDSITDVRYVKVSIADTGTGMDESTKERIFDPFFTTKGMGRGGTGLGLATVYGIVKGHNGMIDVYSELGQGTTFNIYLPASDEEVVTEKTFVEDFVPGGAETVLLVDDEKTVIEVCKEMLESLGYTVYVAQNGEEAMTVYMEKRKQIDLVILDMIMPGISGGETFDRLRKINPEIQILLSSGYSIDGEAQQIIDRGCKGFLQKPFQLKILAQNVRKILS